MTRLLQALLVLAASPITVAEAGLPQLSVRGRNLEVLEALVSVEIEGNVAEIVYELAYQNDTARQQEGEFSITLPPGATVSTYAIDVRGAMRPAVSVEKERARNAYESIKRQMVDPGIVEREAGNVYRTRVFPLEPLSAKRVRIGFLRELDPGVLLELPLACEGRVGRFELTVRHPPSPPVLKELALPPADRSGKDPWRWTATDIRLRGSLLLPPAPEPQRIETLRVEGAPEGIRHFVVQGALDPQGDSLSEAWRNIRVIWDASYSGRFRDHDAELAALDRIWEWLGDAEVTTQVLSTALSPPVTVKLAGGGGAAVKDSLQTISYDGSADYSKIPPFEGVTFLVGDGLVGSPLWEPRLRGGGPVFLLNSTGGRASPSLLASVDAVLDPRQENFLDLVREHRDPPMVEGLDRDDWCFVRLRDRYRVTGVLPLGAPATLRLRGGGMNEREISTAPTHGKEEWNFARRLWAQDRLSELEWQRERDRIREHAMAERLASDLTSLIVLERMEDHVRYRIPPPEPELLTEYRQRLPRGLSNSAHAWAAWNRKRTWYATEFPWIDTELKEEAAAVAIFTKAARSVFKESAIEDSTIPALEAWVPEAEATAATAAEIDSEAAYQTWQSEAKARYEALRAIRENIRGLAPNQSIPVSVRGFVQRRGVIEGESPFELLDAVKRSGGPNSYGSHSRVFLYRDGQRTGYNLESRQAAPIPLRPCDMIVVESPYSRGYRSFDGFADPFADPLADDRFPAAAGGAPIFEPPGQATAAQPARRETASAEPFSGAKPETSHASFLEGHAEIPTANTADDTFLAALRQAPDPAALYRESLSGEFGKEPVAPATVVEAARFLYFQGEAELAWQILTTLCELEPNPVEATRALAFWLAEFGSTEQAADLLDRLLAIVPDKGTKALVGHDRARLSGVRDHFHQAVIDDLEAGETDSLAAALLTDFFGLGGRGSGPSAVFQPQSMPSDLRLVVSCAGGEAALEVAVPSMPTSLFDGAVIADSGGWRLDHPRILEYQVRRALPGSYVPSLVRWPGAGGFVTVRLDAYLRWGREDEEQRSATFLLDTNRLELPAIEFGWADSREADK